MARKPVLEMDTRRPNAWRVCGLDAAARGELAQCVRLAESGAWSAAHAVDKHGSTALMWAAGTPPPPPSASICLPLPLWLCGGVLILIWLLLHRRQSPRSGAVAAICCGPAAARSERRQQRGAHGTHVRATPGLAASLPLCLSASLSRCLAVSLPLSPCLSLSLCPVRHGVYWSAGFSSPAVACGPGHPQAVLLGGKLCIMKTAYGPSAQG